MGRGGLWEGEVQRSLMAGWVGERLHVISYKCNSTRNLQKSFNERMDSCEEFVCFFLCVCYPVMQTENNTCVCVPACSWICV